MKEEKLATIALFKDTHIDAVLITNKCARIVADITVTRAVAA